MRGYIVNTTDTSIYPTLNVAGIGQSGTDGVDLSLFPAPGSGISSVLNQDMLDLFADLGYTAKDGDKTAMITQFQLDHKIIKSRDDENAGTYGPKTRTVLAAEYALFQSRQTNELIAMEKERKLLMHEHDSWQTGYNKAQEQIQSWGQPRIRETSDGVRSLQEWLQDGRYYQGTLSGQMTPQTLSALRKYQKSKNIKTTGKLDEPTQSAMIDDIIAR